MLWSFVDLKHFVPIIAKIAVCSSTDLRFVHLHVLLIENQIVHSVFHQLSPVGVLVVLVACPANLLIHLPLAEACFTQNLFHLCIKRVYDLEIFGGFKVS